MQQSDYSSIPEPATIIILAGGRGARMGDQPKAQLPWAGTTLLHHIVAQARGVGEEVLVVGEEVEVPPAATRVADVFVASGPLGGLHAGLRAARFEQCLVLACDMPFVRPQIMRALLELGAGCDAAVPLTADGPHPLCAAYARCCVVPVEEQLAAGGGRVVSFFERVRVRWLDEHQLRHLDPDLLFLFNINTWQDYERAQRLAAGRAARSSACMEHDRKRG